MTSAVSGALNLTSTDAEHYTLIEDDAPTMSGPYDEDDASFRTVYLNDQQSNERARTEHDYFNGNAVSTTKYTVPTFLPRTLLEFFSVVANSYFLVVSLFQMFAPQNPESNKFTTAGPLFLVYVVTCIKQAVEDWKRFRADCDMNGKDAHRIIVSGHVETVPWHALQAGDTVVVKGNEEFPADVLLLGSSEEEARCFTETANLDGETNLKRRNCVTETASMVGVWKPDMPPLQVGDSAHAAASLRGKVEFEQPNAHLYAFTGSVILAAGPSVASPDPTPRGASPTFGTRIPLSAEHVVLRGCVLRNCRFVIGTVLFTGHETKVMKNMREAPLKRSKVYRTVNRCIFLIFASQLCLMVASAIGFAVWNDKQHGHWYLARNSSNAAGAFLSLITFFILYNNLVPISLYVSMDMIKIFQAKRMEVDRNMRCEEKGVSARARTSDLNEDLGQIEYVFSDKTGTLTCNIMDFRKCSVGGMVYGLGTTEIGRAAAQLRAASGMGAADQGSPVLQGVAQSPTCDVSPLLAAEAEAEAGLHSPPGPGSRFSRRSGSAGEGAGGSHEHGQGGEGNMAPPTASSAQAIYDPSVSFDDPRLLQTLRAGGAQADRIESFLRLLSACHTVIPEYEEDGSVTYRAASPDEEALVKAARCLGYEVKTAGPRLEVAVCARGQAPPSRLRFHVLAVNEFNSTRKRMSVLVQLESGEYVLYAKGADTVMFERAAAGSVPETLDGHLTAFASEGLRTLVCAERRLSAADAEAWLEQYRSAANAMEGREEKLEEVAEAIEADLTVVGATAIEDKLQDGVPATVAALREAGIRVWVLTGDKQETAVNIGHACRLLDHDTRLLILDAEGPAAAQEQLARLLDLEDVRRQVDAKTASESMALVVEGKTLLHLLGFEPPPEAGGGEEASARRQSLAALMKLSTCCRSVVACRVSPKQKASIVKMIRNGVSPPPLTLAIGDGANDVNMIQTAHVGVGINGQEGVQAVNASDYAIAQFRFLRELLLVHGRQNYRRISVMILYSFYKNIALVFTLFLFNFYNGQSGTTFYDSIIKLSWNIFLAWPIIIFGVLDMDVHDDDLRKLPTLYWEGPRDAHLNVGRFLEWILLALAHGAITYFLPLPTFIHSWTASGTMGGLMTASTTVYTALFLVVNLKCAMLWHTWHWLHHLALWGSIAAYYIFLPIYNTVFDNQFSGTVPVLLGSAPFWAWTILIPVACTIPDAIVLYFRTEIAPSYARLAAERKRIQWKPVETAPARPWLFQPGVPSDDAGAERVSRERTATVRDYEGKGFGFTAPETFRRYKSRHRDLGED